MSLEYEIINNGIDRNIEIIVEKKSGFYNLTKTGKMVQRMLEKEHGKRVKIKHPNDWARLNNTNEYKNFISEYINVSQDNLQFSVHDGELKYQGMYVHELLYDHFLQWLSPKYALLVAMILRSKREEENSKFKEENSKLRDIVSEQGSELAKKDTELVKKVSVIRKKSEENHSLRQIIFEHANMNKQMLEAMLELKQSNKELVDSNKELADSHKELADSHKELVDSQKELHEQNEYLIDVVDDLHDKADDLQETANELQDQNESLNGKVDILSDNLVKTAYRSSVSPNNPDKEPYVCILKKNDNRGGVCITLTSKQKKAMITHRNKEIASGKEEVIPTFYIANGVSYRNRVAEKLNALFKEAKARSVAKPPKTGKYALRVKFNSGSIYWHPQPYISFQTIVNVIKETIDESQVPELD